MFEYDMYNMYVCQILAHKTNFSVSLLAYSRSGIFSNHKEAHNLKKKMV